MEKGYTKELYGGSGYVRYIDHMGDDLRVVEAARISYKSPSKGKEQDIKLLRYLMKNRHTSPFEQCNITYNIKMPIFVMRQFVRHRTFRLNEWSGRYSELEDDFYLPTQWRAQDTNNKQGSVAADLNHGTCTEIARKAHKHAYSTYQELLRQGVAKEMARVVLPVSIFTEIYINVDLHNLMHFLKLRLDGHAQSEIRDVAQAMIEIAEPHYPETIKAFREMVLKE